jgi:Cytochrome P460
MNSRAAALLITGWALVCAVAFGDTDIGLSPLLQYTGDGLLKRPEHYRDWVFLTSGFDMSYSAAMQMGGHTFDNVFVDPQAYKVFTATGTWPDGTVLVIENRAAEGRGSLNKRGNYQGLNVVGLEIHVKDAGRFSGKWAFFDFDGGEPAAMIPRSAACYSCHAAHAALDTTFVQFYPTLLAIAERKGTLTTAR